MGGRRGITQCVDDGHLRTFRIHWSTRDRDDDQDADGEGLPEHVEPCEGESVAEDADDESRQGGCPTPSRDRRRELVPRSRRLLRLVPVPPAVRTLLAEFEDVDRASHAVSAIIAAGVMPAALEMMDSEIIRAVEASVFAAGLPLDIGAALLIELDGLEAGIDAEAERVQGICLSYGARNCRLAHDEAERKKLWAARKGAFGAIGRITQFHDSGCSCSSFPTSRSDGRRLSHLCRSLTCDSQTSFTPAMAIFILSFALIHGRQIKCGV